MNPIGLHAMVLTPDNDPDRIEHAVAVAARLGYDLLELPILDPATLDGARTREVAERAGIALATSLGLTTDTDVSSEDPMAVEAGVQRLRLAVEVTAAAGGTWMCGVLASALGRYPAPPTSAGRANAVAALQQVAAHAADHEVRLGLEIVNRYESNLVNTTADGLALLDDIGSDQLLLHLDTYHALIEEEGLDVAVRLAGDRLGYVHVGQNDRGSLSSGTVDLDGFLAALDEIGFGGPITFEAFSRAVSDPALANTLAVWRSSWSDGEALAEEALAHLRSRLRSGNGA